MKLAILKTFLAAAFLFFVSESAQAQEATDQGNTETVEVSITGMMCTGCSSKVHKVLKETAGVLDNEVKYPGDVAIVKYNPEETSPEVIVEAIEEKTDFTAELKDES
jgi:copper chaperone CopZ